MSEASKVPPTPAPVIPDKLYFRIGEVARLLEVETHTLRFWEGEFPQLKVGKGGTGQRLYRRRDVEVALEIKHLLYEQGYTIPGARQFLGKRLRLKEVASPPKAAPPSGKKDSSSLERLRTELRSLSAMLDDSTPRQQTGEGAKPMESAGQPSRPHTAASPPRRGLHLATRSPERGSSAVEHSPGLFDTSSE